MLFFTKPTWKGISVNEAERAAAAQAIEGKITANGGEVDSIRVVERKAGQVFATVKLVGEDGERQAAFGLDELLESR